MLGQKIAQLRKEKGISQEQLAELLSTSRQAVSKWERGDSYPDLDRLKDLAVIFHVSIDYLFEFDLASTSVDAMLKRMEKAIDENCFDIAIEEIRLIVSVNENHFDLLLKASAYLMNCWSTHHDEALVDMALEYSQKALTFFRPDNASKITLNELKRIIAVFLVMSQRYEEAKRFIEQNQVEHVEAFLAEAEFLLGNHAQANALVSSSFLRGVIDILNSNHIQVRLLLSAGKPNEALDLAQWTISFIRSVEKKEGFALGSVFVFTFFEAICQKMLGLDADDALSFLKENRVNIASRVDDTESLKFYYGEKEGLFTSLKDIEATIREELEGPLKDAEAYPIGLAIYNEVFG